MCNFYISIFCGVNCDIYVYCRLCVNCIAVAFDNAVSMVIDSMGWIGFISLVCFAYEVYGEALLEFDLL